MSSFQKKTHNPLDLIKQFWPDADVSHITYDETLRKGDFSVIRESTHDGTLVFTLEVLQEALLGLVNGTSYCTLHDIDWDKGVYIRYTVGSMRHAVVFGDVKLGCSDTQLYSGQKERIRMPVKCEYVYKEKINEFIRAM